MWRWWLWLFDSSEFMTRAHCGKWPDWLRAEWIAFNGAIAWADFTIATWLFYYRRYRKGRVPNARTIAMAACFFGCKGLAHVSEITVWWWPGYRLYTQIYALAAIPAILVAWNARSIVLGWIKSRSSEEWHHLVQEANNDRLRAVLSEQVTKKLAEEVARRNDELQERMRWLEHQVEGRDFWSKQRESVQMIRSMLQDVKDTTQKVREVAEP
jgi:hypothetical protein